MQSLRSALDVHALLEEDVNDEEDSCMDSHQVFGTDYLHKLSCASELTTGTWLIEVCSNIKGMKNAVHMRLFILHNSNVKMPHNLTDGSIFWINI